jgi:hypothetical protein
MLTTCGNATAAKTSENIINNDDESRSVLFVVNYVGNNLICTLQPLISSMNKRTLSTDSSQKSRLVASRRAGLAEGGAAPANGGRHAYLQHI